MEQTKRNRSKAHVEEMRKRLGHKCVNCGSEENIEYHHIVPLHVGGNEVISNIVPLCYSCHKAVHNSGEILKYKKRINGGRKTLVSDQEAFKIFDLYANGEIGTKKCKELLRISESTHFKDQVQYKRYIQKNKINSIKNKIDIIAVNSELKENQVIGKITYDDGAEKEIIYKNTGKNDIEYIHKKSPKTAFRVYKTDN